MGASSTSSRRRTRRRGAARLEHKGIPFKRTDLLPVTPSRPAAALPPATVPALDRRRAVLGSRPIAASSTRCGRTAALPASPGARRSRRPSASATRSCRPRSRMTWWGLQRQPNAQLLRRGRRAAIAGLRVVAMAPRRSSARVALQRSRATRERQLAWRGSRRHLDRVDGWIADGTMGGEELNAADFQIAPSIGLLMTVADLRPGSRADPPESRAARVPRTTPATCRRSRCPPLGSQKPMSRVVSLPHLQRAQITTRFAGQMCRHSRLI